MLKTEREEEIVRMFKAHCDCEECQWCGGKKAMGSDCTHGEDDATCECYVCEECGELIEQDDLCDACASKRSR